MTVTPLPAGPSTGGARVRHRAGARQHRHHGRAAAGRRADRVGRQLRRHQRQGPVAHPRLRRGPGQPGDEAGQLRLLRHAGPGDLAAVRRHRRRLHHRADDGDGRADQPRRRVAAARELLDVTTSLALAASTLAPRFGERPQDALCLGLLAQMGAALLHHNDPDGYAELVAEQPTFARPAGRGDAAATASTACG